MTRKGNLMKSKFLAVCFSIAGLVLASNASAQAFGEFLVAGGWSVQSPASPASSLPPEKAGDYKPLADNLQKRLPQGADLRQSASGFHNLGDFVSAVHASSELKIPFGDVKARMTAKGGSLYMAIAALRPDLEPGVAARNVRASAYEELRKI